MSLAEPPEESVKLAIRHCDNKQAHSHHGWGETKDGKTQGFRCPGRSTVVGWRSVEFPLVEETEPTDLDHIILELLPEINKRMRASSKEYGETAHRDLGQRGQYADMYRKWIKLRRAMWDGEDTTEWREQPREILLDLIGHSLLTICMIDRGDG